MKAVWLTGNGGFDKLDYRSDVAVPVPSAHEVLIRVGAAAVNNTDINTRTAWYSKSVERATEGGASSGFAEACTEDSGWTGALPVFPRIQGADACGTIIAIGSAVDVARIGQRVLIEPVFRDPTNPDISTARYFGSECDGGFAEYACAPSVHAHAVDSPLSDAELASFPCAYAAAENILTRIELAAGERVLITGASGGVGSAAAQLARRRGARITAITTPDKAKALRALGAENIVHRDEDILQRFGHEYFDAVVDIVGGAQFGALLNGLKRGGRYGVAGAIAGPMVALDLRTFYLKDLRLIGCTVLAANVFANLIGYIERGEIKPLIAATYPLSQIIATQTAFLAKSSLGKIVLLPGG